VEVVSVRTPSAREEHTTLVKCVAEKYRSEGYEVLVYPTIYNEELKRELRVDVLAVKSGGGGERGEKGRSEKVGVECMVVPSYANFMKRIEASKGALTKLVLAVPSYAALDVEQVEKLKAKGVEVGVPVEVLKVEVPESAKYVRVSAKVPEPVFKRLRELARALRTEEGRLVERAVAELVERLERELKGSKEGGATGTTAAL
jgi:hypothetical protein